MLTNRLSESVATVARSSKYSCIKLITAELTGTVRSLLPFPTTLTLFVFVSICPTLRESNSLIRSPLVTNNPTKKASRLLVNENLSCFFPLGVLITSIK